MGRVMTILAAVVLGGSSCALAGANPDAKAAIHLEPHVSRTCAKNFPELESWDIVYASPDHDADIFPVFFNLTEYQGFDYALWWPGLYSCAFTSCSDVTIGTITWPWDGVSHAWHTCQEADIAVFAWGWIYDFGEICLMSHPAVRTVVVWDCDGNPDMLERADRYDALIGGYPVPPSGRCPADTAATDATSWGQIKALFR